MAVLGRSDSEDASYLDLAEFIASRQGVPGKLDEDLRELFRRVLFNVAVANRDDHLRNHGFIRDTRGWRLAPAYDLNPSTTKDHHVLALDESSTEPDLGTVLATAAYYKVTVQQAERGCGAPAPGAQHVEEQGQAAGAVGRGSRRVGSLLHGVTATSRGLWQ
jgi:serine/threonine-protein kinase HipA